MQKNSLLLFLICLFSGKLAAGQGFYALDTIQKIEIQFSQSNWDYILDTSKQGKDGYTIAQWVKINGVQFDSAGVKYKGNSSYNPNNQKNPLHIELNYIKNQDYQGYKDVKLSNGFKDPSFTREVLSYSILRNYMHAPLSNFAKVYINGQQKGLYANTEAINKSFADKHFYSNNNSFFFMDNFGGDLSYKGPDSTLYYMAYTMKSDYGWGNLVNLCYTLKNNINQIETVLDVDRCLWMIAYDNILVNLDSYVGQPRHNYYIYRDHNGRFNPIVWDVNEAFGNFTNSGSGNLTITQEQNMSPTLHINDSLWPLIKKLLGVIKYKRMYIAHMRTLVSEFFSDSSYYYDALYLQSIIDTAYQADPNKFFTYSQFLSNTTTNVTSGPFTAAGLTYLMEARKNYLNGTTDFQQVPPALSNIQVSDTFPLINDTVYITAQVSNAIAVLCGMRYSVMEKFTRYQMLDNGLNGDGSAGDGVYGIAVPVNGPEVQYYIYTENNNAGIFSPPRAEHEWYTLHSDYATVTSGEIIINELMAQNATTHANGLGNYGDWIELFNTSPDTVSLNNLYLSDDFLTPAKWQFPDGVVIPPAGYLMVWADIDIVMGEYHTGFKLSATGEQAVLSYSNGTVIDSATFPAMAADVSYSRCPNGTGSFIFATATFGAANNCSVSVEETNAGNKIIVFPNPTNTGMVNIFSPRLPIGAVCIYDFTGRKLLDQEDIKNKILKIDMNVFGNGIYLFLVNHTSLIKTAVE